MVLVQKDWGRQGWVWTITYPWPPGSFLMSPHVPVSLSLGILLCVCDSVGLCFGFSFPVSMYVCVCVTYLCRPLSVSMTICHSLSLPLDLCPTLSGGLGLTLLSPSLLFTLKNVA